MLRLTVFALLYVGQGLPWGFVTVGYSVLLADLGVGNTEVGVALGLAYLPWTFKIGWGPLLDAVPPLRAGRRRPFIVGAQLVMGASLLALLWVDPKQSIGTVAIILFVNNTFASLQDVAVDAMAVDLLEEHERGLANSLMWAGKSLGVVAGGGGGTLLAKYTSWGTLFVVLALIVWAIMLVPLFVRERPPAPDDVPAGPGLLRLVWFLLPLAAVGLVMYGLSELGAEYEGEAWVAVLPIVQPFAAVAVVIGAWPLVDRSGFAALRGAFSFSVPWWGIAAGVLTALGYAMIAPILTRVIRADLKVSEEGIAILSGIVEPTAGVIGALAGGVLVDRLGARRAIGTLMVGIAACLATWAAMPDAWPEWPFLITWSAAFYFFVFGYNAATLGLYMAISSRRVAATHFALYMASTNLTYAFGAPLGGLLADTWGLVTLFAIGAVVQVATIVTLWPLDVARAQRVYAAQPRAS